ncbi:MAG: prolipoprotein diacylglyceryl transferase [Oscillospiraceae bacterium]|nr:prolipoprotein diacylglyceryl transferase [Oscillospiraceae bacterium]
MNPSNYTTISLFGLEINPPRSLDLGSLSIHFYGIIIACGLLLAVLYGCKRCKEFGFSADDLTDGVLWIVPFAILCARLYYCAFEWDSYKNNPISVLYIWNGGLAIYGGVIGAALGVILFGKIKKLKVGAVLDLVALGFLIGQAMGRWGNFFNREAFGAATDSFMKMGLFNKYTQSWEYYHPTFLYESVWNVAGFVLLHYLSKKRQYDGQIALGYAAWYGLGRTFIEGLRMDSLYWGDFRVSQLLAAVSCFAAVAVLMYMAFRKHDPAKLQVNLTAARLAKEASEEETAVSGMKPLFPEEEEK